MWLFISFCAVFILRWNLESDPAQVTITGENVAVQSIFRRLQLESEQTLAMSSPKAPDDSAASGKILASLVLHGVK